MAIYAVIFLVCLLGYRALFGANGFVVYEQKKAETEKLGREIRELQEENDRRQNSIKALKNDPETIEKEAREQLRYARPGEVIYTLPRGPAIPAESVRPK